MGCKFCHRKKKLKRPSWDTSYGDRQWIEPDLIGIGGAAEGLLIYESLGLSMHVPLFEELQKSDGDSEFLVNMMSASKAAMAKDEKIR